MIDFEAYLTEAPIPIHSWDGGKTWNGGGFLAEELRKLHQILISYGPNAVALETGAGNSTIAMLYANPAKLVSIAPDI